ncbi:MULTISPECIES: hypothetical protein [Snodgrassella]|uniref:hypothetical protein n=1 Tax=Snodgrassella TaxID=1193515 RepID=UPI0008158218|nr:MULTISPECIES: hypothetical protein [Snodgrassella]SCB79058.1 hypothetical protein GA0061082_101380 [Snodgrassella sp. R-53583]
MICAQVRDYLQTQGLKVPAEEVQMAILAIQSVLELAQAEIDMSVLWYEENGFRLAQKFGLDQAALRQIQPVDLFTANNNSAYTLRQMYLAFDSIASRHHNDTFAVYLYETDDKAGQLYRLLAQGSKLPARIECGQQQVQQYLFARTATTGWLNQVNDVQQWLADGNLSGEQTGASQLAAPITGEQGQILGVLHTTHQHNNAITDAELIDWTALAIAITPLLQNLHNASTALIKG